MPRGVRRAVRVEGVVQGVGFRPFVYSLATGLGLGGSATTANRPVRPGFGSSPVRRDPVDLISRVAEMLLAGRIVAVKGLGGYHLAVLARKHREDKPFAVMVSDVDAAARLCAEDEVAAGRLTQPAARRAAPGHPLHHLLLATLGAPVAMTSGNVSDEPIVHVADELGRLSGIADARLTHDRPIHVRAVVADLSGGVPRAVVAARFHTGVVGAGVVDAAVRVCVELRDGPGSVWAPCPVACSRTSCW